jgi:hypothetical protein
MKEQSILDSAGPVFIVTCLAAVLVVATWIMVHYRGDWGSGTPEAVVTAPAESH